MKSGKLLMHAVRHRAIVAITFAFRRLERQVSMPSVVTVNGHQALRYVEQSVEQALILKLARYLSGLNACELLLSQGYVQEQAALQRTLDEIGEDITFLSLGHYRGFSKLHRKYLTRFWQEEFEEGIEPINSNRPRYQLKRSEIRGWIERIGGESEDSPAARAGTVMTQAYSGYVHAAAPHIMEMCGGDDYRFFTSGLLGTSRIAGHAADLWNYVYRGLLNATLVARVVGDDRSNTFLVNATKHFEEASGTTYIEDTRPLTGN